MARRVMVEKTVLFSGCFFVVHLEQQRNGRKSACNGGGVIADRGGVTVGV